MSTALPMALWTRFQKYIGEGLGGRATATRLKVSAATVVRWLRRFREQGDIMPKYQGRPKGHGKLAFHRALLEELVAQDGDITLPELTGALKTTTGVTALSASIRRVLSKFGYTHKKVAGCHRTAPRPCKKTPQRLVQASYSGHADLS